MPVAACELPGEARSAARARRFLRAFLRSCDALAYSDGAELVLTELVANAALHAKTKISVSAQLEQGRLRLEVSDASERRPSPRSYSEEATTGRGLTLIEALATSWGIEARPGGKTVWAEMSVDQGRVAADGPAEREPAPGPARVASPGLGAKSEGRAGSARAAIWRAA